MYEFVQILSENKALLIKGNDHFVASFSRYSSHGPEVLVFPSNETGEITQWIEVDGGRGYASLEDFLIEKVK